MTARSSAVRNDALLRIMEAAEAGQPIDKQDCVRLLEYPANSLEADMIRAMGDAVSRHRFHGKALLLGQIGAAMAPCDGGCLFCAFAKPTCSPRPKRASPPRSGDAARRSRRPTVEKCLWKPDSEH